MSHTFTFTRTPFTVWKNEDSYWAVLRVYAPNPSKGIDNDPYRWFRITSYIPIGEEAEIGEPDIELVGEQTAKATIEEHKLIEHTLKQDLEEEELEESKRLRCENCKKIILEGDSYMDRNTLTKHEGDLPYGTALCMGCYDCPIGESS